MNLFHISFNGKLDGVWEPKPPAGWTGKGKYPEPETPRISCSPTIKKCFYGVFPNVSKYFEKENYPYMDFFVYAPLKRPSVIVSPNMLIKQRWVHDAHITDEHWLTKDTEMVKVGRVRIYNTNKSDTLMSHPFGDKKEPERSYGPKDVRIELLTKPNECMKESNLK